MSDPSAKESDLYTQLFRSLDVRAQGYIFKSDITAALERAGILSTDIRVKKIVDTLRDYTDTQQITPHEFSRFVEHNIGIVEKALKGNMIIPDFQEFCEHITDIYNDICEVKAGKVADYIPQLAKVDPNKFAISVCTVDGQVFHIGDSAERYCIQSTCKPINYCIALEENGEDVVHEHVGREPSGVGFNEITLNKQGLPHNPMINAGAIMANSLIKPTLKPEARMEYVLDVWKDLTGGAKPSVDTAVYESERSSADRNFALAYFMREKGAFPPDTDIVETLEFYFKCCSIEVTAAEHAIVAATIASGGVNPMTGKRVFTPGTVKNCLSLMYSCGLYDFSGEFAFTIGIPAKSGVSGSIFIVIPNVMGITIWSPPLDEIGNSVKGLAFCKKLIQHFNFHTYDSLLQGITKHDPRLHKNQTKIDGVNSVCSAASQGDLDEMKRLEAKGVNLNDGDYDNRTPIHLAASEGQTTVVQYCIEKGVDLNPQDRWGGTPLVDAYRGNHAEVIALLEKHNAKRPAVKDVLLTTLLPETLAKINLKDSIRLCWAASTGDVGEIKRLVANHLDLDAVDYDGRTAMHLAASEGHEEVIRYLIDHKTNVNPIDRWGNTPLADAHRHHFPNVIALLKANGGKSNSDTHS